MSAKTNAVTVGGEPRIDFLPPEIRQKKQTRRTIRGLVALVVVVLAVCVAAYAGTTTIAIASQLNLDTERARTMALLQEQGEYSQARTVSATLDAAKNARLVASAPEVLWAPYLADLVATLPEDAQILEATIDTINAVEAPPVPKPGIEEARIGTIELSASFASLSAIAAWVDNLESLRGFVGSTVNRGEVDEAGRYTVEVSLQIGDEAREMLYFETVEAEDDKDEEAGQ